MNFTLGDLTSKMSSTRSGSAEDIALVFEERRWTYGELDERIGRLTAGLLDAGFRHGDTAAVIAHNRPEWVELFFAIARIGGVFVPVNFFLAGAEIEFILKNSGASWVFCEQPFRDVLDLVATAGTSRRYVTFDADGEHGYEDLIADRTEPIQPNVRPEDLFTLLYTSGTTGLPKGAMHSQATVLWNSYHQIADFQMTADDTWLTMSSLCWGAGFHDLTLATWWAGGKVVLKESTGFEPARFAALVEAEGVNRTLLVPSALRVVVQSAHSYGAALQGLGHVLCGGEPVPVTLLEQARTSLPDCQVSQVYGLSEFPSLMLLLEPEVAAARVGSAGKACGIATVRVVDDEGRDIAGDEVGEIICRSPAVMLGYLGLPEASAETLRGNWLHTGDLARLDSQGYVYIVGRAKDMYISGGLNVYPAEVERVIAACPGIVETAVVGVPDEQWGEAGHAIVVLEPGAALEEEDLRAFLEPKLAKYKLPRSVDFRPTPLPRTLSGKVQKAELRAEHLADPRASAIRS
jgi:fatty-acyl-CoA synthase